MKHTKNIFLISTFILSMAFGDLASPTPFKVYQPDGEEFTIYIRGNHLSNWHEYLGWTIVQDSDKWWVYALDKNGKKLTPSQIRIGVTNNPTEINPNITKGIKPEPHQLIDNSQYLKLYNC